MRLFVLVLAAMTAVACGPVGGDVGGDSDVSEQVDGAQAEPVENGPSGDVPIAGPETDADLEPTPTTKASVPRASVTTSTSEASQSSSTPAKEDRQMDAFVAAAVADLAAALDVDHTSIEIISDEAVTWPDRSLGCPTPGRSYQAVLTPGRRVVLGHDNRRFNYHGGAEPFLCLVPSDPVGGNT